MKTYSTSELGLEKLEGRTLMQSAYTGDGQVHKLIDAIRTYCLVKNAEDGSKSGYRIKWDESAYGAIRKGYRRIKNAIKSAENARGQSGELEIIGDRFALNMSAFPFFPSAE